MAHKGNPKPISLDSFRAESEKSVHGGPTCRIYELETRLTPEERGSLRTALADLTITIAAINRVLKRDHGYRGSANALYRHRMDRMECERCRKAALPDR